LNLTAHSRPGMRRRDTCGRPATSPSVTRDERAAQRTAWERYYKKALAREQKENRTVMLPLIVGEDAQIPDFIEDKIYIDLRTEYFSGVTKLIGMIHGLDQFRVSRALAERQHRSVREVWDLLQSIGFEPYVILGKDDFDEILKHGGRQLRDGYAVQS
jgi:hypothetical protein